MSAGGNFPAVGGHQCCKNVGKRQLPPTGLTPESTGAEGEALHAPSRRASCLTNCNDRAPSTVIIPRFFFPSPWRKIPVMKPGQVCMKAGDQAVSRHDPECSGAVLQSAVMNSRRTKSRESTFLNFQSSNDPLHPLFPHFSADLPLFFST